MEPSRGLGAPARPAAEAPVEDALEDDDLVLLSRYFFPDTDSDDDDDDNDDAAAAAAAVVVDDDPDAAAAADDTGLSAPAPPRETCAVCTERIDEAQLCNTFPCLHRFCIPCLKTWLPMRNSCPLCNAAVSYLIVGVQANGSYSTIPVVNDPRTRRDAEDAVRAGTAVDFIWVDRPGEPAPSSVTLGGRTVRALSPPARMGRPVTDSEDSDDDADSDEDSDEDEDDSLADPTFHPAPARGARAPAARGDAARAHRASTRGGARGGARGAAAPRAPAPAGNPAPIVIGDSPPASPRRPSGAAAPPVVPVAPRPRPAAEPPAPALGAAPRQPAHQTQAQARAQARTQARAQAVLAQALAQALTQARPGAQAQPRPGAQVPPAAQVPPGAQAQPRPAAQAQPAAQVPPGAQARPLARARPAAPPQAPPLCAVVAAAAAARKRPASASEAAPATRGPKRPSLPPPPGGPAPPRRAPARAPALAAAPPPPRPLAPPAAPPPPQAAPPPPPAAPPPPPVETRDRSSLGPRPAEQGPRKCVRKTRHVDAEGAPAAPGPTRYLPISGVSSVVAMAPYLNKTVTGDCLPVLDMETGDIGAYVVLVGRACNMARALAEASPGWSRRTCLPEAAPGRVSPPEYPGDPAHGLWMTPVGGMLFDQGALLGGRSFHSLDSRHPWTPGPADPPPTRGSGGP
ncbi:ubiquitin E3 ligase ICP0 [Macacine alphaherpesvirus 1]|nr:ubiquitin E3 ligase ICP0 [Macacine alphaherpesvirus 1]ARS02803.1 ubiquitin E3 ligase ICP0 [Macacine alphaherpesvirus 1]